MKYLVLLVSLFIGFGAEAQDVNKPIDIIGLHHWTRQMIKDSLAKHVPGSDTTLSTHACGAEILQLGFVRTAAIYYPTRVLVSVVEPQDALNAAANPPITTTREIPESWQRVLDRHVGRDGAFSNGLLSFGIKYYGIIRQGKRDSIVTVLRGGGMSVPSTLDSLWTFLMASTTEDDFQRAKDVLQNDSSRGKRTLALAVLANFSDRDEAWHLLLHTLRDKNDVPGPWLTAQEVLTGWLDRFPRTVDWSSQAEDVRALFAGANLWAFPVIMKVLKKTQIDPALAPTVLRNNGVFVLGYAGNADTQAAAEGQALLTQISGHAYGSDMSRWTKWVESL